MNKNFLSGFIFLALVLCSAHTTAQAATRPNVVIFLADDQGWGDVSLHGNTQIRTPNIDLLGREGARLDRFYVCSVCAPTRAEFLTGRYHSRGGVRGVSTGQERLNVEEKTIADAFQAAGYATGAFGKWHNGSQWPYHPNARGFQEYYGFTSGHWGEYFDPPLDHNGQPVRGKGYIVDDLTDHALAFIEKNRRQPFFCYIPYNSPHSPFSVPEEYWQRFKNKPIQMRGPDGEKETIEVTRAVLAMVENIDANVGRVLRKLEDLKLTDNTIVIYFSDNGPNSYRWNGGMKGRKGSTDEGGLRVPFMIRWPAQIKPGTTVQEIAGAIDLLPTLTAMAGIPRVGSQPLDGKNIYPLLKNTAAHWADRMIFSHHSGRVSVRTQQHRLDDRGALYDMSNDPGQQTDIGLKNPEVTGQLATAVASWRKEVLGTTAAPVVEAKGKGKGRTENKVTDDRPFPVGYANFPRTPLPARDGIPHGNARRSSNAPNSSYFVNWIDRADKLTWDIDVHTTGRYEVEILYTCPEADAGSLVELSFKSNKLTGKVAPGWDPPLINNQDVIPRPSGESFMKDFRPLKLGSMQLEKGRGELALQALQIAGRQVMEVRSVILTLR